MSGPSQPKVTDETLDNDRVRSFLDLESAAEADRGYYLLKAAYRQMQLPDFDQFISFFNAAGRDLDTKDSKDRTLYSVKAEHRHRSEFIKAPERLT